MQPQLVPDGQCLWNPVYHWGCSWQNSSWQSLVGSDNWLISGVSAHRFQHISTSPNVSGRWRRRMPVNICKIWRLFTPNRTCHATGCMKANLTTFLPQSQFPAAFGVGFDWCTAVCWKHYVQTAKWIGRPREPGRRFISCVAAALENDVRPPTKVREWTTR